jgi:hypothetical protein
MPGNSEPEGNGTRGGETDVLNAAVTNLAGEGRSHASGLFQLGRDLFEDLLLLGVIGQQKAIPPSQLLGISLVDFGERRELIDAHDAQFYCNFAYSALACFLLQDGDVGALNAEGQYAATGPQNAGHSANRPYSDLYEDKRASENAPGRIPRGIQLPCRFLPSRYESS